MARSLQCRGTNVSGTYCTEEERPQAQTCFVWPLTARLDFNGASTVSAKKTLSWSGLKSLGHRVDHGDNRDGQRGAGGLQYVDFFSSKVINCLFHPDRGRAVPAVGRPGVG